MKVMFSTLSRKETPSNTKNTPYKLNRFMKKEGNKTLFLTLPLKINKLFLFKYIFSFYFKYKRFSPEIVIGFHPIASIPLLLKRLKLIASPVVYYWWDFDMEIMGKRWGVDKIAFLEMYCVKNADIVFTNSLFQYNLGKKLGINIFYFKQGVEEYFNNSVKKIKLPGKNKFKILYIGNMNKFKNMPSLIKSVDGLNVDLILLGEIAENLEVSFPNNVYHIPSVEHMKIPSYVKSASIVICPSDQDGTLKMYEYIRMGKCILSKKGKINYILNHNETTYSTDNFRGAIKFLKNNPTIIKTIEKNVSEIKVPLCKEVFNEQIRRMKCLIK